MPLICCHPSFFADDTDIYYEAENLYSLINTINKELRNVMLWVDCNKLALNIDKTNVVLFLSPRKKLPDHINIRFGKKNISKAKYEKFLGILSDERLTWKYLEILNFIKYFSK